MKQFKVLNYKMGKMEQYDVLPYFRDCWKDKNKYYKRERETVQYPKYASRRKQLLKQWIIDRSKYMFWARCEYEFLMASWPFGSYRMKEELKKFLKPDFNIDDYTQCLNFENIIIADMHKIDIHEQIMMNIDTIVDILYVEFKLDKPKKEKL